MTTKMISIVAVASVMSGCTLFNSGDSATNVDSQTNDVCQTKGEMPSPPIPEPAAPLRLCDENFEYDFGKKDGSSFTCKNKTATIVDLNNFIWAVCWNGYLSEKKERLSDEDAKLLEFFINAQCFVAEAIADTALTDIAGEQSGAVVIPAFEELKKNFRESDAGIRSPMREWASVFDGMDKGVIMEIHELVQRGTEGMRKDKRFFEGAAKLKERGVSVGEKWQGMRTVLKPYLEEMRKARDILRYDGKSDPSTRKAYENVRSGVVNRWAFVQRKFETVIYDLPFCILTYKAYKRVETCKGFWGDNEEKMKDAMRDYSVSISGTEVLKRIVSPYAASCYAELLKFFKSEMWEREFKDFVNETKLYRMSPATDQSGEQSNQLEKW